MKITRVEFTSFNFWGRCSLLPCSTPVMKSISTTYGTFAPRWSYLAMPVPPPKEKQSTHSQIFRMKNISFLTLLDFTTRKKATNPHQIGHMESFQFGDSLESEFEFSLSAIRICRHPKRTAYPFVDLSVFYTICFFFTRVAVVAVLAGRRKGGRKRREGGEGKGREKGRAGVVICLGWRRAVIGLS